MSVCIDMNVYCMYNKHPKIDDLNAYPPEFTSITYFFNLLGKTVHPDRYYLMQRAL